MKWLFLNNHPWLLGGLQSLSADLARGLMERGDTVHMICFGKNSYADVAEAYPETFQLETIAAGNLRELTIGNVGRAWRTIRRIRPEAIFVCNSGFPDFFPYLAIARRAGVRHIVAYQGTTAHVPPTPPPGRHLGGLVPGLGLWRKRFMWSARTAYANVTLAMFHSDPQRKEWEQAYGFRQAKRELWFAPVDLNQFRPCDATRARVRRELGISDEFVIGGVGTLNKQKSFHVLVDAGAHLKVANRRFRIVLVGDGPCAGDIAQQAKRLGLDTHVTMLGFRRDTADLMNAMDAFVLPSTTKDEALGIVIAEAMACGVPCVVTNLPGPSRIAGNGSHAQVVPCRDARAIATALMKLMDDRTLYNHFREMGFERAAECERSAVVNTMLDRLAGNDGFGGRVRRLLTDEPHAALSDA